MIVHPTTPQLLRDVRNELLHTVAPEVHGAVARVALEQIDIILEQCAVRSADEIAWMAEELAEMLDYADDVVAATGDEATAAALVAARDNAAGTLHLDDMAHDYTLTSEALSCAIEACMADPDRSDLLRRGVEILRLRRGERETVVRANWRLVGRG